MSDRPAGQSEVEQAMEEVLDRTGGGATVAELAEAALAAVSPVSVEGEQKKPNTTTSGVEGEDERMFLAAKEWLDALCVEVLEEPEPFHHRDVEDDARSLLAALAASPSSPTGVEGGAGSSAKVSVTQELKAESDSPSGPSPKPLTHIPALLSETFGMARSQARCLIDTGKVAVNGTTLEQGEHDLRLTGRVHLAAGNRQAYNVPIAASPSSPTGEKP